MKKAVLMICLLATFSFSFSQTIFGKWTTFDDETGEAKAIVEIYEEEGKVFGVIRKLLLKPEDTRCTKCKGEDKDRLVIGMNIIKKMEKDDDEYSGGTITDPKTGKIYTCKFWLDEENPNKLKVRGYILFFFRTQYWERHMEE